MSFFISDHIHYETNRRDKEVDDSQFYGEIEDKPKTEQDLFALQDIYLKIREEQPEEAKEIWKRMFSLVYDYSVSLLKQRLKNKTFISPDEVADKSTMATINFMNQYLTRKNFRVGASFAGMLKFKVVEALYKDKNNERNLSLNTTINDTETELSSLIDIDKLSDNEMCADNSKILLDNIINQDFISKTILKLFKDIDEILDDNIEDIYEEQYISVLFRMLLFLQLKKNKKIDTKRAFLDIFRDNPKIVEFLELSFMELYNRIKDSN